MSAGERMDVSVETRIAVVTGAERGLGREIARQLGRVPGMTVMVTAREIALASRVSEEIVADGGRACADVLDVNDD